MKQVATTGNDVELLSEVRKGSFGACVCNCLNVELVFDKGDALGVVCLDLCEKTKDDGEETEVDLGWISARVGDCLGHALFPIIARGVLQSDVFSHRRRARDSVASFSFE